MIEFTQGDTAVLELTATDGDDNPIDLTDAIFTSFFRNAQGLTIPFPNSQHTADPDQITNRGQYTLSLGIADTQSIPQGPYKEIITKIDIGLTTIYYHGVGICTVLGPIPRQ